MMKDVLRFTMVLIVIVVFALIIYPKVYTYEIVVNNTATFTKINNFTGTVWIYDYEVGWQKLSDE